MLFTVSSGKSPGLTFFPNGIALSHCTSIKTPLSDRLAYESLREDELISSNLQEGLALLLAVSFWIWVWRQVQSFWLSLSFLRQSPGSIYYKLTISSELILTKLQAFILKRMTSTDEIHVYWVLFSKVRQYLKDISRSYLLEVLGKVWSLFPPLKKKGN